MKVKIVCQRDYETKEVELPMNEGSLLEIQGNVLERDTLGYIAGADVKYYDDEGNEIENVFLLNKQLQN
ncbi:hypothetical protein FDC22_01995 [Clostridium botulinum]|uniref:Uncharacterized protein n=1 Tax=Clostridium botulinum (strain Okra / Type B1) TaxID=498213 RepID=B1IH88_CLOBK|nr:hypothetical protein [Clostridium botulinum]ACA43917.1 hypothetical protein CLD_3683 [Clostridium botulinum B1 str. Okra]MBD5561737.1 hypothetical protein [Clostridium botulinum]MBD5565403.1 hypothetical protein [Clostridium botulinum]MBD5570591.1 hypothetical protein [Clostridium botulinum]MBD5574888.1 hypothetical protein [Clostridium botulinum]